MIGRPGVVVFDVNETLSDMAPMARRFEEVGAPPGLAATWFAGLLRDGFALTVTGGNPSFADVGQAVLRVLLGGVAPDRELDAAVRHVMAGLDRLDVHPDVIPGIRALQRIGFRLVTLTNGAAAVPDGLLTRAGLREMFEHLLSVTDAGAWKPDRRAYEYAATACGVAIGDALLVAVHPWDISGAGAAGMRTAWITRDGRGYPDHMGPPDLTVSGVVDLAEQLGG